VFFVTFQQLYPFFLANFYQILIKILVVKIGFFYGKKFIEIIMCKCVGNRQNEKKITKIKSSSKINIIHTLSAIIAKVVVEA
jgi:hypothetical protein